MTDPNILVGGVSIIVLVTALTQIIKRYIPSRFAPLVSIVVGIGLTFLVAPDTVTGILETLVLGLVVGVISSGAYSGGKALIKPDPAP